MTTDTSDAQSGEARALARVKDIQTLFDGIKKMLKTQIALREEADQIPAKAMVMKLSDLQNAHTMLIKAEEAYHAKFANGEDDTVIDYDALRIELGRRLDRIRDARGATGVS